MDTKLDFAGRDHYLGSRGIPVMVQDLEELVQRAYIAIAVPRGSLPYNRAFGGDRLLARKGNSGLWAMAENALADPVFENDQVKVVSAVLSEDGTRAFFEVSTALGTGEFEVIL